MQPKSHNLQNNGVKTAPLDEFAKKSLISAVPFLSNSWCGNASFPTNTYKFKVFLNIDQIFTSLDLRVKILHTSDIVLVFANFQLVESQKVVDVNQKYANIWF